MSTLSSLVRVYDRLAARGEVPTFGYSQEKIGFLISLNEDGTVAGDPIDLHGGEGKRRTPRLLNVPQPEKRTSGIAPNFLWDKTAYVLGITAGDGKRTKAEHAAFVSRHRALLQSSNDAGLKALLCFLAKWTPEEFTRRGWSEEMKDRNVVFALESERRNDIMIHDRPAARDMWEKLSAEGDKTTAACLVTGKKVAIARLHPSIKGVWGAQTAGASIVSFNLDAFTSYGHEQGDNAPVSEVAAFAYTTALNHFLKRGSGHRVQVGDTSTVFWADASDAEAAAEAEDEFAFFSGVDEKVESGKVGEVLERIRRGLPLAEIKPLLPQSVRFFILGLAPNAARLSVRFYLEDDFGEIAERYIKHLERMRIEPSPRDSIPPMWKLLAETAPLGKTENIAPNLAGEWMRAILTNTLYPRTLLASVLMRFRADHEISPLRVAILKSVLIRNFNEEAPVALDPHYKEPGYLLGRLFATYEQIQTAALGRNINATIRDKFYGAASAQPRKVFTLLERGSTSHLSKLGKGRPGYRVNLEKQIGTIMEVMSPADDPFPAHLSDKQQALFGLGYYHQRNAPYSSKGESASDGDAAK